MKRLAQTIPSTLACLLATTLTSWSQVALTTSVAGGGIIHRNPNQPQ